MTAILTHTYFSFLSGWILTVHWFSFLHPLRRFPKPKPVTPKPSPVVISVHLIIFSAKMIEANTTGSVTKECACSRSKFLSKLLKTFDKTFREIFPVFISTKRREKPSAFFDNNFVNNAYFSEAASSSSSHLASSSSKAPISSRMTCLCLWSS